MAEGEPKTGRPPSELLLGLNGGGYGDVIYKYDVISSPT